MKLRLAAPGDNEAIRGIYNREVLGSTVVLDLVERSEIEQRRWLEEHSGPYPAVVAVDDDETVAGFGSVGPYRPKPAYATTVEDSVYVDPRFRGRGVGRVLLADLVARCQSHGFHSVIGRVVGRNEASVALHRSCGFELIGIEREVGRKFGRWLDVTVMQRLL